MLEAALERAQLAVGVHPRTLALKTPEELKSGQIWIFIADLVIAIQEFGSPMYPYGALDTKKIHTPITLGIRRRAKPPVFKLRKRRPCGFDSHRPLHFPASLKTRRDTGLVSTH